MFGGKARTTCHNLTLDGVIVDADLVLESFAILTVHNDLELNGTATLRTSGGSNFVSRTSLELTGPAATLSGTGEVLFAVPTSFFRNNTYLRSTEGSLTIGPGITVRTVNGEGIVGNGSQPLINQGTIISNASRPLTVTGSSITNEGTLQAMAGTLVVITSGALTNSGSLSISSSTTINVNGAYEQLGAGVISIDLAGTGNGQFGTLNVTGQAALDGTLNVNLVGGFEPSVGSNFQIVTYASRVGEFATINGLSLPNGLVFVPQFNATDLTLTAAVPLRVADNSIPSSSNVAPLTMDLLEPVVTSAIAHWAIAGVDDDTLARLHDVEVHIGSLSGPYLGAAAGDTIWIDDDAAGYAWFIDSAPWDHSEVNFAGSPYATRFMAGRVDLLSAVTHELGHVIGLEHDSAHAVMGASLDVGLRRPFEMHVQRPGNLLGPRQIAPGMPVILRPHAADLALEFWQQDDRGAQPSILETGQDQLLDAPGLPAARLSQSREPLILASFLGDYQFRPGQRTADADDDDSAWLDDGMPTEAELLELLAEDTAEQFGRR